MKHSQNLQRSHNEPNRTIDGHALYEWTLKERGHVNEWRDEID